MKSRGGYIDSNWSQLTQASVPLIIRRVIQTSPARVFGAFSSSEALSQWFTPSADISLEALDFKFVTGGRFRLRYTLFGGRQAVVGGVYEVIEPPTRIVMSWIWEAPDPLADVPMRVTFEFFDKGDATEVVITHEQIPSDQACTIHEDGWEGSLNSLEHYLGISAHEPI